MKTKYIDNIDYSFVNGDKNYPTIISLHGTGGDELSMLDIAYHLKQKNNNPIISIAGSVKDHHSHRRYFKRNEDGTFDYNSLKENANNLVEDIEALLNSFELKKEIIIIGYSNGANIALDILFNRNKEFSIKSIVAYHPMYIYEFEDLKNNGTINKNIQSKVLVTYGEEDEIVTKENFDDLLLFLQLNDIKASFLKTKGSHRLSEKEILSSKKWLDDLK